MGERTSIEWTRGDDGTAGATWNPVTGCTAASPGCERCYAKTFAERWRGVPGHSFEHGFDLTLRPERLDWPLRWRTPRRVFLASVADLFHDQVPDDYLARVFATMALAQRHTFQVLTKRHARMRCLLSRAEFRQTVAERASDLIGSRAWRRWQLDLGGQRLAGDSGHGDGWTSTPTPAGNLWTPPWPLPNVWLGVSTEDQRWADIRVPTLLDTPAAVRWISAEPLLGPIDLNRYVWASEDASGLPGDWEHGLSWVVVGGESGPGARPVDLGWVHALIDRCRAAAVPVFVKQLGRGFARAAGVHRVDPKGSDPQHWPAGLRIREYPATTAAAVVRS